MQANPATPPLLIAVLELLDAGMSLMPIDPDSKMPLVPWKPFQENAPSADDWEVWASKWPSAHVGLITGAISQVVVIEGDSEEAVTWILANFPHTPRCCRTKRGMHFYYRHPGGRVRNSAGQLHQGVDVRGDGGYVKVPPSAGYAWELDSDDWTDLPMWPGTAKVIDLTTARVRGPKIPLRVSKGNRDQELARFAGTLAKSPSISLQEIVDALAVVNDGFNPPLEERDVIRIANSIYATEQAKHSPQAIPGPASVSEFPAHLLAPGGVLGGLMSYIEQSAPFYQPVFALAASLATLGAVLGQKVATSSNLRTNLYILGIGHTGTGKEAGRAAMIRLLTECGMAGRLSGENFASPAAIMRALVEHPVQVAFLDEIGHLFKATKNPMGYQAGILNLLTKLFSYAGGIYLGDSYGSLDRKREPVRQPNLCIYGTSVPGRVFDNLTTEEVTDGFLPRWLLFELAAEKPPRNKRTRVTIPSDLRDMMKLLEAITLERDPDNMLTTVPSICPFQPDAEALMDAFEEECRRRQNEVRESAPMEAGILNRAAEHAAKLALVRACSDACGPQPIFAEHAQWAIDLVRYVSADMITQANERVFQNEEDAELGRVLNLIPPEGIPHWQLLKRSKMKALRFQDVVATLKERGDLLEQFSDGELAKRGRSGLLYYKGKI